MSVDVHKYGFASKGVSVVCFRDPKLRQLSYVPSVEGCEGLYITTTLQGSRSGAIIAQAWATVQHMGDDGYRKMASTVVEVVEQIKSVVDTIPELELLVTPDCAIVPIRSKPGSGIDIYQVRA